MCGALFRRSRPNTNFSLLRLHTKDKSVRFRFKLLFFLRKKQQTLLIFVRTGTQGQ